MICVKICCINECMVISNLISILYSALAPAWILVCNLYMPKACINYSLCSYYVAQHITPQIIWSLPFSKLHVPMWLIIEHFYDLLVHWIGWVSVWRKGRTDSKTLQIRKYIRNNNNNKKRVKIEVFVTTDGKKRFQNSENKNIHWFKKVKTTWYVEPLCIGSLFILLHYQLSSVKDS